MRLAAFLASLCVVWAQAGPLWYADGQGVHRLETDTNAVTANIGQSSVVALTLNQKDGTLWSLTSGTLAKYDASGAPLLSVDLKTLATNFNAARRLALDPSDDSIWVAGGNNAFHLDSSGRVLASVASNDVVQDVGLAQDGTLWLLSRNGLSRYSAQGASLGSASLAGGMQQAAFLTVDDANGVLWLAGSKNVFQVALALPLQPRAALPAAEVVSGIALDSGTGTLWVAGQSSIFAFRKDGTAGVSTSLAANKLGNFQVLDFDAQSQALWLGHEKGLSRLDGTGRYVATIPAAVAVTAISAAPSGIVPIVTLVSPVDGALTNNAYTPIRLRYDASCFGRPCNFPSSVFAAYTLTAMLNGQSIGSRFQFDPAANGATFLPAAGYPQGVNTVTAYVTDGSGRRSKPIAFQFTVDTIPPHFINVTPPDGSAFTSARITLQGSVDDPQAPVSLQSFSGATIAGPNPTGPSFAFGITLKPGTNSFLLTSTDAAGNVASLPLAYVYNTLTLTIASPANNAIIDDTQVTVTGSFTGATSANVTVNGVAATVTGTSFSATVPLQFGTNTLTVVGTSPAGATDTRSVTVVSTAPSLAIASPASGATIDGNSVLVRGSIQAVANSGVQVNGVVASIDGANNFFAVVPLAAGSNTLTAKVTSPRGASATRTITVNASGAAPAIVATADPASGMAPLAVKFTVKNTTNTDATYFFNTSGPFAVPAGGTSTLSVTYPEGVFTDSIVVNGGSRQSFVINVTSIATMDAMLQALWRNVTGNLAAGNIEGALVYFAPGMRDSFRRVLNDIAPALPTMFASFPAIKATSLKDGDAEYFVAIARNGKKYGYFLYFMRDGDGVWRLHTL